MAWRDHSPVVISFSKKAIKCNWTNLFARKLSWWASQVRVCAKYSSRTYFEKLQFFQEDTNASSSTRWKEEIFSRAKQKHPTRGSQVSTQMLQVRPTSSRWISATPRYGTMTLVVLLQLSHKRFTWNACKRPRTTTTKTWRKKPSEWKKNRSTTMTTGGGHDGRGTDARLMWSNPHNRGLTAEFAWLSPHRHHP